MARPPRWQATLDAAIQEACLAVRMHNDPAEARAFEAFTIHMNLAWLYLLHAEFVRDGIDFRYWDPKRKRRLVKIDGEPKRWELARSASKRWPDPNDPVHVNVKLFVQLRNRLEHRHAHADVSLMVALSGHAHALLLNFENEVAQEFGSEYSLGHRLRIPLFVGTFSEQGAQALRQLKRALPKDLQGFLTEFRSGLDEEVASDPRFEFRLRATLELAKRDPDAIAFQFTRLDDLSDEQRGLIEKLGSQGMVVTKERTRSVSGKGLLLPRAVVETVASKIPFRFTMHDFVCAWKVLGVRPSSDAERPEITNEDFCIYDEPSGSYRYTQAFCSHLIRRCATPEGFRAVTGRPPSPT